MYASGLVHELPTGESIGGRVSLCPDGSGNTFAAVELAAELVCQCLISRCIHARIKADVQRCPKCFMYAEAPAMGIAIYKVGVEDFCAAGSAHGADMSAIIRFGKGFPGDEAVCIDRMWTAAGPMRAYRRSAWQG